MKKLFFVLTAFGLLWLAPATRDRQSASTAPFGIGDACAQTGTCKSSPPDICFVNGNAYYDREWISGEEEVLE